jgi:hypothetical protein
MPCHNQEMDLLIWCNFDCICDGFFMIVMLTVQKTMAQGKEYCERKINLLKSNFDELLEVCSYQISLLSCSAISA